MIYIYICALSLVSAIIKSRDDEVSCDDDDVSGCNEGGLFTRSFRCSRGGEGGIFARVSRFVCFFAEECGR